MPRSLTSRMPMGKSKSMQPSLLTSSLRGADGAGPGKVEHGKVGPDGEGLGEGELEGEPHNEVGLGEVGLEGGAHDEADRDGSGLAGELEGETHNEVGLGEVGLEGEPHDEAGRDGAGPAGVGGAAGLAGMTNSSMPSPSSLQRWETSAKWAWTSPNFLFMSFSSARSSS